MRLPVLAALGLSLTLPTTALVMSYSYYILFPSDPVHNKISVAWVMANGAAQAGMIFQVCVQRRRRGDCD